MSRPESVLDRLVGSAVRELAAQARPSQLAPGAVAAGLRLRRRMRIQRAAGATLAAMGLIAAIAVPSVLLHRSGPTGGLLPAETPTAPPSSDPSSDPSADSGAAVAVGNGWFVVAGGHGPFQVWSRDKRRYEQVEGHRVWAAPVGPYAAVENDDNSRTLELIDLRGRSARTLSLKSSYILEPQWSPDGTRLLLTLMDKDTGGISFTIVDAGSLQERSFPIDRAKYFCTDYCLFSWSRDGTEVAWPLTDEAVPRSELEAHARKGIQLFSTNDGRATRRLPVRGEVWDPFAWSPDGRLVVVTGPVQVGAKRERRVLLVDTVTGAVKHQFDTVDGRGYFISNDRFVLTDGGAVVDVYDRGGNLVSQVDLPGTLANSLVQVGPPD